MAAIDPTIDHYAVLGVSPSATENEIKKAYRALARMHHPDQNPGDIAAEARFKEVSAAFDIVGDGIRRKEYDDARTALTSGFGNSGDVPLGEILSTILTRGLRRTARSATATSGPATPPRIPFSDPRLEAFYVWASKAYRDSDPVAVGIDKRIRDPEGGLHVPDIAQKLQEQISGTPGLHPHRVELIRAFALLRPDQAEVMLLWKDHWQKQPNPVQSFKKLAADIAAQGPVLCKLLRENPDFGTYITKHYREKFPGITLAEFVALAKGMDTTEQVECLVAALTGQPREESVRNRALAAYVKSLDPQELSDYARDLRSGGKNRRPSEEAMHKSLIDRGVRKGSELLAENGTAKPGTAR